VASRGVAHLAHERENVGFGVAEEGHPEVVLGHARNEVRLIVKFCATRLEPLERSLDVRHLEIENGTGMVKFRLLGFVEHQAHAAAIEEAQLASAEQVLQSEDIAIECSGAIDVVCVDGDLTDAGKGRVLRNIHCAASGRIFVSIANYIS